MEIISVVVRQPEREPQETECNTIPVPGFGSKSDNNRKKSKNKSDQRSEK
jgi:hypothetical protein